MKGTSGPGEDVTRVSLVYMVSGFLMILVIGLLGLTMRLNQGGLISIQPELFYSIMTLHGLGMVTGAQMMAAGGFAHVLGRKVPLSARWLWLIYILYMMGMMLIAVSTIIGGFAAGWTAMYPLPFSGNWGLPAALAATAGVFFGLTAFLVYCVHILIRDVKKNGGFGKALAWSYIASGGKGSLEGVPEPVEIIGVAVAIPGIVCGLLSYAWLIPIWAQAGGILSSFDVLLSKNTDYSFGHLMVNLTMYLAAGLLYATLPKLTGRKWETSWPTAVGINLIILLVPLAWPHHLYQDFAQPDSLQLAGEIIVYLSTIPAFAVTILGGLALIHRAGVRLSTPILLFAVGMWGWAFGGVEALLDATIAVNQVMHNMLWIPGHFHTYFLLGVVAFSLAYLYQTVHELSGREEPMRSRWATMLLALGGAGFVLVFSISGALSIPRRSASYFTQSWVSLAGASIPAILVLALGFLWLLVDILLNLRSSWRGTYLEHT